jgi:hypothetical protein
MWGLCEITCMLLKLCYNKHITTQEQHMDYDINTVLVILFCILIAI